MSRYDLLDPLSEKHPELVIRKYEAKIKEQDDYIKSEKRKFMEQFVLNRALSNSVTAGHVMAEDAYQAWAMITKYTKEESHEQH